MSVNLFIHAANLLMLLAYSVKDILWLRIFAVASSLSCHSLFRVAVEPVRGITWLAGTLERYLDANPDTRNVLQWHLARDLAGKVDRLASGRTPAGA
jgi:hypothetical protein